MRLVLAFVASVGSVATSGVGSSVRVLSKIFIRNNLLFKLVRNFSLALKIILSYLEKTIFQLPLYLYQNVLIQ